MMKTCTELAAALTAAYHHNNSSRDIHPLSNGVLVSMCFPHHSCVVSSHQDHVAASWIHTSVGPAVLPGTLFGLVLDPSVVDVLCVAPIDLASDARDNLGCGPFRMDPIHGSIRKMNVFGKYMLRRATTKYKNLNFGSDIRDWTEIPCANFFDSAFLNEMDAVYNFSDPSAIPFTDVLQRQYQAALGHPVCNSTRAIPPKSASSLKPIFAGPDTWSIEAWPQLVRHQQDLQHHYPLLWNEFVIRLPDQMNHIVQAVFYRKLPGADPDRDDKSHEARQLARLLKRPLLELQQDGNLTFQCRDGTGVVSYGQQPRG